MTTEEMTIDEMWDQLKWDWGVTDQTLEVVCGINGFSKETMLDVLYVVSGYRSFDQYMGD